MKKSFYILFIFMTAIANTFCDAQTIMQKVPTGADVLLNPASSHSSFALLMPPCTPGTNDNIASATLLMPGAAAITGTTCQSTVQAGENLACNSTSNQTVWYSFVATSTTSYVIIDATGSSCYIGSCIWPGSTLPNSQCPMIDCQAVGNGPLVTAYRLVTTIGSTYSIQITYPSGGPCGNEGVFTIRVANSYGGTLSNPGAINTCSTPLPGCYFTSTPTAATVTSTCPSYPLVSQANLVNTAFYSFTTAATNSTVLSFQEIISSNCGPGNVNWFFYRLYDANCNLLTCGDLGNLQNNVACNNTYILEYSWEELNCTYTQQWPYQYVPTGTVGCGSLPIELAFFEATAIHKNVSLTWKTLSETNNQYFTLERSSDGISFEGLHNIQAAGTSNLPVSYATNDVLIADGIYYYRLKQTDYNGRYSYSKSVYVNTFLKHQMRITPNPISNITQLIIPAPGKSVATIFITNAQGQTVFSTNKEVAAGTTILEVDLSEIPGGIYFLKIVSDNNSFCQKIVKL